MKRYLTLKNLLVLWTATRLVFYVYSFWNHPSQEKGFEVVEAAFALYKEAIPSSS